MTGLGLRDKRACVMSQGRNCHPELRIFVQGYAGGCLLNHSSELGLSDFQAILCRIRVPQGICPSSAGSSLCGLCVCALCVCVQAAAAALGLLRWKGSGSVCSLKHI